MKGRITARLPDISRAEFFRSHVRAWDAQCHLATAPCRDNFISMTSIPIPAELLDEANQISDLQERVARFIKAEITRRKTQKKRYGEDIVRLVDQAFAEAASLKKSGFDQGAARDEMTKLHEQVLHS